MTDSWSASNYDTHASFVPKLGNIILDKLDAKPSERILDFGCGDGVLTQQLAQKCHTVVGIDASPDMIAKAKQLRQGIAEYHVADGHCLDDWFDEQKQEPFDAVFSSATLHWLKEPAKAIRGIHHVLKPNGRMVAEFGGFMNCGEVHTALITAMNRRGHDGKALSPWYFPSEAEYSKLLEANGFRVDSIELVPRMTQLNTDIAGWLTTFGFAFLEVLKTEQERQEVLAEIMEHLRPVYQREDGKWFIMYVRLRVVAYKQ
ncbi:S-adenosyl-L-methionine-dependent methyltransferase [Zychaea mexicana]|uniref:S-adenosyl-L-methionine-dependent methyltransferase n=1 Tax=Zychaea mexicana TaxID=64656 RepID=UPI0022FEFCB2|nr:S-adenosyl-L-methionine-dependent methyltransferase [Zychaea mexicana]KAI9489312.1 S-adenosyl-L-methionine-dependent methyltransferase [Zychaea mexicana]